MTPKTANNVKDVVLSVLSQFLIVEKAPSNNVVLDDDVQELAQLVLSKHAEGDEDVCFAHDVGPDINGHVCRSRRWTC